MALTPGSGPPCTCPPATATHWFMDPDCPVHGSQTIQRRIEAERRARRDWFREKIAPMLQSLRTFYICECNGAAYFEPGVCPRCGVSMKPILAEVQPPNRYYNWPKGMPIAQAILKILGPASPASGQEIPADTAAVESLLRECGQTWREDA